MTAMRVVVADSLMMFRAGVREALGREGDFRVIEVANLDELVDAAAQTHPDVALIDLDLPTDGGIAAVRRLAEFPSLEAIVWSLAPDRDAVLTAIRSGASGFLDKELSPEGLIRSLRGIRNGEAPLSRALATRLIEALHSLDEREHVLERAELLSWREREVLELVARGARNKEIGAALFISEFTVKRHVQNILEKLEVPSRRAAAAFHRAAFGPLPAEAVEESEVTAHLLTPSEDEAEGTAEWEPVSRVVDA